MSKYVDLRRRRRLTVAEAELLVEMLLKHDTPRADRILDKIRPAITQAKAPLTAQEARNKKLRAERFAEALAQSPQNRSRMPPPEPLPFRPDGVAT